MRGRLPRGNSFSEMGLDMKYTRISFAIVTSVAVLSAAQAADLPVKAVPIYTPAVTTWTGFYAGAHLGAVWHLNETSIFGSGENDEGAWDASYNGSIGKAHGAGFIGGGQAGYNWQIGDTVLGLEATISGLTGKATARNDYANGVGAGNTIESKINWLATFRGRAGWLMHPDTLLYATGGLAVGGVKNVAAPSGLAFPGYDSASENKTKTGYVVGAGMEHRLNRDWSVAVEGLYVDLGSSSAPWVSNMLDNGIVVHTRFKNSAVIGMLKVNRAF